MNILFVLVILLLFGLVGVVSAHLYFYKPREHKNERWNRQSWPIQLIFETLIWDETGNYRKTDTDVFRQNTVLLQEWFLDPDILSSEKQQICNVNWPGFSFEVKQVFLHLFEPYLKPADCSKFMIDLYHADRQLSTIQQFMNRWQDRFQFKYLIDTWVSRTTNTKVEAPDIEVCMLILDQLKQKKHKEAEAPPQKTLNDALNCTLVNTKALTRCNVWRFALLMRGAELTRLEVRVCQKLLKINLMDKLEESVNHVLKVLIYHPHRPFLVWLLQKQFLLPNVLTTLILGFVIVSCDADKLKNKCNVSDIKKIKQVWNDFTKHYDHCLLLARFGIFP
jgi:6-pyruvoyl-tetrahydropterin synthase